MGQTAIRPKNGGEMYIPVGRQNQSNHNDNVDNINNHNDNHKDKNDINASPG
jgi:hypothetical protein